MKIGDPNHGGSIGLDHPYVFGRIGSYWMVWHRRDGEVVDIMPRKFDDCLQEYAAMKACYQWNGVDLWPDADTIAAIDQTP